MILYRITTPRHAEDLSGTGAKLFGGRWNSPGFQLLYTAETLSLAMLEKLVHAERSRLCSDYALTSISIPEDLELETLQEEQLPENWKRFPGPTTTALLGDGWLQKRKSLVLKVPSAVNSFEHNFLINPLHPGIQTVRITEVRKLKFDLRLA